ncbi:MAG: hypothetical protein KGZ86_04380 [Candidatus Latescibacteria bacterium]|nr:hypothetical protein [Candidatus Latescibacterota bacterium]
MFSNSAIILMLIMLSAQPAPVYASNQLSKISELRLYSDNGYELEKAEGMMSEIVVTAEYPITVRSTNRTFNFTKVTVYLTFVANLLVIVFFISIGIATLLSTWKQRKNRKQGKGPFSLPPFSNRNIDIGKDYACESNR